VRRRPALLVEEIDALEARGVSTEASDSPATRT
jgi:hypothetical protein